MITEKPLDKDRTKIFADVVNARNLAATPILDFTSSEIQALAMRLRSVHPGDRDYLQAAHERLSDANMGTVYSIDDDQPASVTIAQNKGACVQRMAALEALARAVGIPTRVHALWTVKSFWFERLPLLKRGLPDMILYSWPQFYIEGQWVDFDELYEPISALAARAKGPFSNSGESVFSAVKDQPVDFFGKSKACGRPDLDLSPQCTSAGIYDTRDELQAELERKPGFFGRLLFGLLYNGRPIRRVAEPGVPTMHDPKGFGWRTALRAMQGIGAAVVALLLVALALFIWAESTWAPPKVNEPHVAFAEGSVGTEIVPLSVMKILPDMFPDQFQPGGPQAGDWITQFGFTRRPPGDPGDPDLPVGFTVSHFRPKSGAPSPVPFVGVGCSACHSAEIRTGDGLPAVVVPGGGSNSINFLAWTDALKTALFDRERMTAGKIIDAYETKYKTRLSLTERIMIAAWLPPARESFEVNVPKFDSPYSGAELLEAHNMPSGPSRTQPFRNLVRLVLDRPAASDFGYSKIPAVFWEARREWGQFDGDIRDLHARSALAAMSSGATLDNMGLPEISNNIKRATDYTKTLAPPSFAKTFGVTPDPAAATRGKEVYATYCQNCHGAPGATPADWVRGKEQGVVFPYQEIGTDKERVIFRHGDDLANRLFALFPASHPFHFAREDLRPVAAGSPGYPSPKGYISYSLEGLFTRAPYLHNGSVPTLAELINLEKRRQVYYRGNNLYDVSRVGLEVPEKPDPLRYFRYDASARGNSNAGHDYPWKYPEGGWNPNVPEDARKMGDLKDLLEYLKTL